MTDKKNIDDYVNGERAVLERWPWLLALVWLYNKVGLATLLLFGIFGIWTGAINSPLSDMAEAMIEHVRQTDELIRTLKLSK